MCVDLVTALCERPGKIGKGAAYIHKDGAGVEGLKYGGRLERLNLMTLEERRNRSDIVELSKGLSAIPWNSFFHVDNSDRTIGHSMKLAKERFRLDIRKHFFSQRVVNR